MLGSFIISSSCPSDSVSLLHAPRHVSQPRVCHQQIWRSPLPADQRLQICQIPGAAYSGTCKELHNNTFTHCCICCTWIRQEGKFLLSHQLLLASYRVTRSLSVIFQGVCLCSHVVKIRVLPNQETMSPSQEFSSLFCAQASNRLLR